MLPDFHRNIARLLEFLGGTNGVIPVITNAVDLYAQILFQTKYIGLYDRIINRPVATSYTPARVYHVGIVQLFSSGLLLDAPFRDKCHGTEHYPLIFGIPRAHCHRAVIIAHGQVHTQIDFLAFPLYWIR